MASLLRFLPSASLVPVVALVAIVLASCATAPPITKLVGGRQITTRSVGPEAYEHASRAMLYEDQQRWREAAVELRRALAFDGEAPELHAHLAEILLRLGEVKDAEAQARASLEIASTPSGLLAEAHVREAQGDLAGMVASLRRARDEVAFQDGDDDAETTYLELAEAELRVLDVAAARATLEALTAAEPSSGTGHMRLTAIYWAQGEMAKAEAQLRRALDDEPNQIEALLALAWIHVATGRDAEAQQSFREALDRSESALEIAAAYARFLASNGNAKEAEQLADDLAVPDASLDMETIGGRVELERSARRLDRALYLVARARALGIPENEKSRLSLTQAALLKEQGKTAEALAVLLAVARPSVLYFEARLRAAELLRDMGKFAEATRTVEEAAPLAGGDRDSVELDTTVSLALIDEKRGEPAAGIARLVKLLKRKPGEGRAIMAVAALEERRGGWKRALDLVERHLAKQPGSVEALNFWGFVAADHHHALEHAEKRLQVANALDPGSGGLLDSLGWVRFRAKDLARASMFLEQAIRLEPGDPEIQWHLGEICAERNERERAAALFRRALGASPDERLRRKIAESLGKLKNNGTKGK